MRRHWVIMLAFEALEERSERAPARKVEAGGGVVVLCSDLYLSRVVNNEHGDIHCCG